MYILIKTDEPEKILVRMREYNYMKESVKRINRSYTEYSYNNAHFLYAKNLEDAKKSLNNLHDINDSEYWEKRYKTYDEKLFKECAEYSSKLLFEPNKLSNSEIKELCAEYITFLPPKFKTKLLKIRDYYPFGRNVMTLYNVPQFEELEAMVDKYALKIGTDGNVRFGAQGPSATLFMYGGRETFGILNRYAFRYVYYIDFLGMRVPKHLKSFWEFYKKTLNVYVITIYDNEVYVMKKPEKHYMQDEILHLKFDKNHCYCNRIKVPEFVFNTNKENAEIDRFNEIKNVDIRSIFIKKVGIEKFIKYGRVIDSWENYPENEWWVKSEYQLIDLAHIFKRGIYYNKHWYDNILYLCMKNQTTGEYHLEGVTPDCVNLYSALKMRYKNLNLSDYEIKNIK